MTSPPIPHEEPEEFSLLTSMRGIAASPWAHLDDSDIPYEGNIDDGEYLGEIYLRDYHYDRLLAAARDFDWPDAVETLTGAVGKKRFRLAAFEARTPDRANIEDSKIRVLLSQSGKLSVSSTPIARTPDDLFYPSSLAKPPLGSPTWSFYVAASPTIPSLFTKHKTTLRTTYDEARTKLPSPKYAGLTPEVLLYNERNEIMEGSITTPYFNRGGDWVTPYEGCGGNKGTSRRLALEKKLAREGIVRRESVTDGEVIWCSNAVRGFGWGVVEGILGGNLAKEIRAPT